MEYFHYHAPFQLESGEMLPELTIAYQTYGTANANKSNTIWICHALTANAEAARWWPGMIGAGHIIDDAKYFIVCANILGSCYGTTGPLTINPETGQPWYSKFPMITIRDMVRAHMLLREYLDIKEIVMLMGGSMGGYQALEWSVMEPEKIQKLFLIATAARESPWGIAVHTAQRLAIEADPTWQDSSATAGANGLKAARAMGILTYRNYKILSQKQQDSDINKTDHYKASSYINYQGEKLVNRFNAYSYWLLTKAMDSHHLARGREDLQHTLNSIQQPALIMGINSDILCPLDEQQILASNMPNARFVEIDSAYGHDGFMVEAEKISAVLREWWT